MKVLELLDEIVEIVDTSSGVPLTGKILVDAEEILEIVKEIRVELHIGKMLPHGCNQ